jgi:hypothetical protein
MSTITTSNFAENTSKIKAIDTEQPVTPQKPMSIEAYTNALKKEHEVMRLRAGIAKYMFEENMAMMQLNQMRAGAHAVQQAKSGEQGTFDFPKEDDSIEDTKVD